MARGTRQFFRDHMTYGKLRILGRRSAGTAYRKYSNLVDALNRSKLNSSDKRRIVDFYLDYVAKNKSAPYMSMVRAAFPDLSWARITVRPGIKPKTKPGRSIARSTPHELILAHVKRLMPFRGKLVLQNGAEIRGRKYAELRLNIFSFVTNYAHTKGEYPSLVTLFETFPYLRALQDRSERISQINRRVKNTVLAAKINQAVANRYASRGQVQTLEELRSGFPELDNILTKKRKVS